MLTLFLALRILHVVSAVCWGGSVFFVLLLLGPSVRSLGMLAAPVLRQLERQRIFIIMPVVASATVLSGLALYARAARLGGVEWMRSAPGIGFGVGGIAALTGLMIGVLVIRPTSMRLNTTVGAERNALERRLLNGERGIAAAIGMAAVAMAVARYL